MPVQDAHDPTLPPHRRPLEHSAELLGVDLPTTQQAAAHVEPALRVDRTKIWSLMHLERQLSPDASGRVRDGYRTRRRPATRTGSR